MLQKINKYLRNKATKYIALGGLAGAVLFGVGCGENKSEVDIPQIENRLEESLKDKYLTELEQKLILTEMKEYGRNNLPEKLKEVYTNLNTNVEGYDLFKPELYKNTEIKVEKVFSDKEWNTTRFGFWVGILAGLFSLATKLNKMRLRKKGFSESEVNKLMFGDYSPWEEREEERRKGIF